MHACWWTNIKVHNMPHGDILSVLCRLSWTLPLRGRWEGMVLHMRQHICSHCYRLNPTLLTLRLGPPAQMGNDLPAFGWHSLTLNLVPQIILQHNLSWSSDLLRTKSQVSRKRSATQLHRLVTCCAWSMMLSNAAGEHLWKPPAPSAPGCQTGKGSCGRYKEVITESCSGHRACQWFSSFGMAF